LTYVLDTSALLAHYQLEPGSNEVRLLLEDAEQEVSVSVLTLFEFELWLHRQGLSKEARRQAVQDYADLVDAVVPLTVEITALAVELRTQTSGRLPAVDTMIAATAAIAGATLAHRDDHFAVLPAGNPMQVMLPPKKLAPSSE